MKIKIKNLKGIIFFVFIFLGLNFLSWAFELPSIDKSKIRISISPGESGYGEINIENSSDKPRSMKVYLGDWQYLPVADGTKEFAAVNTTPLSCASWISFSPAEFTLAPFSRQKVNYSVKVPLEAKGGHYAVLFFESIYGRMEAAGGEMKAGMNIAVRIASLFYVEAEGTVKRSADIDNLNFKKDVKPDSYSVSLDFKNTGNVDITAVGTCHIMDKQGMVFARGKFNDVYTLPGNSGKLLATCTGRVPKGTYDLVMTLDLGKAAEEQRMGRGPVITKEVQIEIGPAGEILRIGDLR